MPCHRKIRELRSPGKQGPHPSGWNREGLLSRTSEPTVQLEERCAQPPGPQAAVQGPDEPMCDTSWGGCLHPAVLAAGPGAESAPGKEPLSRDPNTAPAGMGWAGLRESILG